VRGFAPRLPAGPLIVFDQLMIMLYVEADRALAPFFRGSFVSLCSPGVQPFSFVFAFLLPDGLNCALLGPVLSEI
jgi:hypothetical protein